MANTLYELYDGGKFAGSVPAEKISEILGCKAADVYRLCTSGALYRSRWKVTRDGWAESWTAACTDAKRWMEAIKRVHDRNKR